MSVLDTRRRRADRALSTVAICTLGWRQMPMQIITLETLSLLPIMTRLSVYRCEERLAIRLIRCDGNRWGRKSFLWTALIRERGRQILNRLLQVRLSERARARALEHSPTNLKISNVLMILSHWQQQQAILINQIIPIINPNNQMAQQY